MELDVVNKILEPYLKDTDMSIYDVEFVKEFGYLILRVSIDKASGIDVEELAKINEYLSERIDKYDADMPEYMLEVCSPGAEKKLRNKDEIKESIGKYIHVEVPNMVYEGYLEDFNDDVCVIKINAKGRFKKVSIKYEEIQNIRLAVKI